LSNRTRQVLDSEPMERQWSERHWRTPGRRGIHRTDRYRAPGPTAPLRTPPRSSCPECRDVCSPWRRRCIGPRAFAIVARTNGATWLIIQFGIGSELRPRHEEPPPEHAHLVLDLTTRHCPRTNGGQWLVPSLRRACRPPDQRGNARTSAGTGDCRRDSCRRRSFPPPSSLDHCS
jgi:hypothetical protein